jgi:hypothetical protein
LTTVKAFGQDARRGGFSHASNPAEKISMCNPVCSYGVGQNSSDVTLPGNILKSLGAPLAREH